MKWWIPDEERSVAYGFCTHCGGGLFWRSSAKPGRYSVTAGALEVPTGLETAHALFVAEASDYHRLDPDLPCHAYDSNGGVNLEDY